MTATLDTDLKFKLSGKCKLCWYSSWSQVYY